MAETLKLVSLVAGRLIFFLLLMVQCGFLTAYPAKYKDDDRLVPIFLLYAPATVYWIYCLFSQETDAGLVKMFNTWSLYVVAALVPIIAIIFALVGDDLDKKQFLGPNTLKVTLCATPLLFLFLVNTASDLDKHEKYRQLASWLSVSITIDLFDAVEMLDIVLDERENSHGISKEFGRTMVAVACLSILLSILQLGENELEKGSPKPRKGVAIIRNVLQIFFVNLPFLIIRLVIFFKYQKDESIFIAKNGIAIFLSSLEIYWISQDRGKPKTGQDRGKPN